MNDYYHVIPVGGLIAHNIDSRTKCECNPRVNDVDYLVIHNALDNREFDEIADAIANE